VIGTNGLTANGTTFNAGDNLNGGAGTDTVAVSISGTHTGSNLTTSSIVLAGIEKILVANYETSAFNDIIDLGAVTGATTVGTSNSSATGDTLFQTIANVVDTEMVGGADVSVTYATSLLTGTTDSVNLAVKGAGTSSAGAVFETYAVATTGVAETLNIASGTASNYLLIDNDNDHKTIVITGNKNLTLAGQAGLTTALDTTVTKIDASAFTGALETILGVSCWKYVDSCRIWCFYA